MTIGNYLADEIREPLADVKSKEFDEAEKAVKDRLAHFVSLDGKNTVDHYHRELGKIMWEYCGMARNEEGLKKARQMIRDLREDFWKNVRVPGKADELNSELEKAGRVADFLELGELMVLDALDRNESCGGHFREEFQTPEGEALRDDENYTYVAAWEYKGDDAEPQLHKEDLNFEVVHPTTRSYK